MPYLSEIPTQTSGHIYVVRYNDDWIKVGRSQDVRARFRALGKNQPLAEGWYSSEHDEWRLNELRMLVFCHENFGDPISGLETFEGDYASTLAFAQALPSV